MRYILDTNKTEELLYTTSINCMTDAESANSQMQLVYEQFARDRFNSPPPLEGKGMVKAIHYIQSFSPDDNITPELAHRIAKSLVRKNFGDDVQAVIATHVDKDHLHSHIIINSYSLSVRKFYANKESLRQFRRNSNGVCKAFGIDIHPNLTGKGRSVDHYEWEQNRKGTSWKEQIRQEIDKLIPTITSLDELLQALEERGYEVKRGKYISIKAPGRERFVRTKTLGEEYTEAKLQARIDMLQVFAKPEEDQLDAFKLSKMLAVINNDRISSIGELEGRIAKLKKEYEKTEGEDCCKKLKAYSEIRDTYYKISKGDYLSNLVEGKQKQREQMKKKYKR